MKEYAEIDKKSEKDEKIRRRRDAMWRTGEEAQLRKKKEGGGQPELQISDPGDAQELEADSVARKVVGGQSASVNASTETVQPQAKSESKALMSGSALQNTLDSSKGGGQGLDDATKSDMGSKMDADLGGVKIHTDEKAHTMAEGINAKAFTHGQDIYFKQGNYNTSSEEGKELLAHELAHTVQQKEGIQRKIQRKAESPETNPDFEMLTPQEGVVNKNKSKLQESIGSDVGTELEMNQVLTLLFQSKDKAWFYAEVINADQGYIRQADVTITEGSGTTADVLNFKYEETENKNTDQQEVKINTGEKVPLTKATENNDQKTVNGTTEDDKLNVSGVNSATNVVSLEGNDQKTEPDKEKENTPVINVQEELAKLEAEAQNKKSGAALSVNNQIAQIKKISKTEQEKINATAKEKTTDVIGSYNYTIAEINGAVHKAYSDTYFTYKQQKLRVTQEKNRKLKELEDGTSERVRNLKRDGEKIAGAALAYAKDQKLRVYKFQLNADIYFSDLITAQIKFYNVPEREQRLKERLGALSAEAMKTIAESTEDLVEQIDEDTANLVERIRDEYNDAAEALPEEKETIRENIEALAEKALEEIESILLEPLEAMKKNADELTAKLKTEKDQVVAYIEETRQKSVSAISSEEETRTGELRNELKNFNTGADKIVSEVKAEIADLPDVLAIELISKAFGQIKESHGQLLTNAKGATAKLKKLFSKASEDAIANIGATQKNTFTENFKTLTTFRTQAGEVSKTLSDSYIQIVDKVEADMAKEVSDYFKILDKTVKETLEGLNKELKEGTLEIKKKVDDVLAENQKVVKECAVQIYVEAKQTATEWEATYYLRRIGEGLALLLTVFAYIIAAIVLIIVAIILILLLIPAIVAIIDGLIALIGLVLRTFLPRLTAWLGEIIADVIWPALRTFLQFLGRNLLRLFKNAFVRLLVRIFGLWILGEGIKLLWQMIVRQDKPWSERVDKGIEGTIIVGTSILAEWKLLKSLFRLSEGYKEFKALVALLGDAKLAARLVNVAKGDLALATELAGMMKPAQMRSLLPLVDDALELKNTLALVGNDALRLEKMLVKCNSLAEVNVIINAAGGDALMAERLLQQVDSGKQLLELLTYANDSEQLGRLLNMVGNSSQLEGYLLMAGGRPGAKYLEELLVLAGPGNSARIEGVLNLANGDVVFLQRLTESASKFRSLPVPAATWTPVFRFTEANIPHFLERHTFEYFNFADASNIKYSQGLWAPGTTAGNIETYLTEALSILKSQNRLPVNWAPETVTLSNNVTVQVGVKSIAGTKNFSVGQFFPVSGPDIITLYQAEMTAIKSIFNP